MAGRSRSSENLRPTGAKYVYARSTSRLPSPNQGFWDRGSGIWVCGKEEIRLEIMKGEGERGSEKIKVHKWIAMYNRMK